MSHNPSYEVTVIATGKKITVYKMRSTGKWVDYENCTTTYDRIELQGLPKEA